MHIKNQPSQKREEQQGTGRSKSQHSCWEDDCLERRVGVLLPHAAFQLDRGEVNLLQTAGQL